MNPGFLRAHLAIVLGLAGAASKPAEPDPEDPPPGLPPRVMVIGPRSPELDRRVHDMGDKSIMLMEANDPRLADLIRQHDVARLPLDLIRHDASNNPVDEVPALPPLPDMARLFADPPVWSVHKEPQSKRPPPCAGHSRLGRPVRVGGEARRPGTADADKRAKRKAAEKSRRRNRK